MNMAYMAALVTLEPQNLVAINWQELSVFLEHGEEFGSEWNVHAGSIMTIAHTKEVP